MEIMKVFSDQYGDERLYSVLMNDEEMALYQAIFSDDEKPSKAKKIATVGGATAGIAGATAGSRYLNNSRTSVLKGKIAKANANVADAYEKYATADLAAGSEGVKQAEALKAARTAADKELAAAKKAGKTRLGGKANKLADKIENLSVKGRHSVAKLGKSIKAHPGRTTAIGAGVLTAAGATGYGIKKLHDRRRDK